MSSHTVSSHTVSSHTASHPSLDGQPPALTVGDLITVPPVQTVVHLSDLARPEVRDRLAESFVLTDEVRGHLRRLLTVLSARGSSSGLGSFLRGHYGSGKSHFLCFLQLLLSGQVDLEAFGRAEPELHDLLEGLKGRRFLVASLSLVSHSAQEPLEAIVSKALEAQAGPAPLPFPDAAELDAHLDTLRYHLRQHHRDTLELFLQEHDLTEQTLFVSARLGLVDQLAREVHFPFRPDPGRAERFEHLFGGLADAGLHGVVLLIDELSEFLHSKTGAALTEDVRFLQYLGEAASDQPLFIVAALQEYLEAAEYGLPGELVRKIKDRYANNLELTTTHIEEIIARRLIHHKPGSEEAILKIYQDLRGYLQGFPVPAGRFTRAYPIHPATILLLDRLKPLLSRSRGIVDFIHHRLRGSEERGIEGMLDKPADTLLTPDAIFDHFQLRIRENVEIAAYDTVVHEYYRRTLEVLFPDPEARALAYRVVKMLILLAISPEPRPYSVRTLTHALLVRLSRIDPDANFQHMQEVLERLVAEGAYVERIPAGPGDRAGFDDVYRLSLKADLNLVAARRVQAAAASLREAPDLRIFEALAPTLTLESLPLSRFVSQGSQLFSIQWQRTPREGRVTVGSLAQIDVPRMVETLGDLAESERDWSLFIGVPYDVDAQRTHMRETLLPALRRAGGESARSVLFWLPGSLSFQGTDGDFLRETLARRAVLARAREEGGTSQAEGVIALLEKALEGDRPRIDALFHHAYYKGRVESVAGLEENLSNLGRPFFDQTLLALLTPVLDQRFPDHAACAPLGRMPTLDDVEVIVEKLYRTGSYTPKGGEADPLATRIVSLLKPLGLIKKVGPALTLFADVSRPGAARALCAHLDDKPRSLKEIGLAMRKGSYGMSGSMFQLLTLALAYSGSLVCYTGGRRREAGQLSSLNYEQIHEIGRGEVVQIDLSPLAELPGLPEGLLARSEPTFARQEQVWHALREMRDRLSGMTRRVREGLATSTGYRSLAQLDRDAIRDDLARLEAFLEGIKAGLSPREGIEQVMASLSATPGLRPLIDRLDTVSVFFAVHLDRFLMIARYLEGVGELPPGLDFAALSQHRSEVQDRLKDEALPFNAMGPELLEAGFRRFQDAYLEAYREAHERWRGPARFQPFEALRGAAGYRLLTRLSRIGSLAADDRRAGLDRRLNEVMAGRCQRLQFEDLLASPRCSCGFALGDAVSIPPLAELTGELEAGIRGYLTALLERRHMEALRHAASDLEAVGREEEAARLQRLIGLLEQDAFDLPMGDASEGGGDVSGLETLFSDRFVRELDQALRGVTVVVDRELGDLMAGLQDRCLPRAEAERLFQAWLSGGQAPSPTTYFRFSRRAAAITPTSSGTGQGLEALLQRRFPELLPVAHAMGMDRLVMGALLTHWCIERGIASVQRSHLLDRWRGDLTVSDAALERLSELADALRTGPRDRWEVALETADTTGQRDNLPQALSDAAGLEQASLDALVGWFAQEDTFPGVLVLTARQLMERIELLRGHGGTLPEALGAVGELPGPIAAPRQELGQALLSLSGLERSLVQLTRTLPEDARGWEQLYQSDLGGIPSALYNFLGAALRWGLIDEAGATRRRERLFEAISPVDEAFIGYYLGAVAGGEEREGAPRLLEAHLAHLKRYARTLGDADPVVLWLDGLRWDLWNHLRPQIGRLPGGPVKVVREDLAWAPPGENQGESQGESQGGGRRRAVRKGTGSQAASQAAPQTALFAIEPPKSSPLTAVAGDRVVRLPVVEDRLRRSREPLPGVFGELSSGIWAVLRPELERLEPGRVAILTAGHGFREVATFGAGSDAPRYRWDGATPWEILVPVVVFQKQGRIRAVPGE